MAKESKYYHEKHALWRDHIVKNEVPPVRECKSLSYLMHCNLLSYLLQEARETGALKEAKDKLEKKVEELTWRVQLEKRLRVQL